MYLQTMTEQEVQDLIDAHLFKGDDEHKGVIWPNYTYLDPTVPPYIWDEDAQVWRVHTPDYSHLDQMGR